MNLFPKLLSKTQTIKLGVLGGTFDPIHTGHLALAQAAKSQFVLDKVLFVPALIPPHKQDQTIASADDRCRMVEMAISFDSSFEVSRVELDRSTVSYTAETLKTLKEQYPNAQLYLILGADSLAQFSTWKNPEIIKQHAHLLVAPRPGSELPFSDPSTVSVIEMSETPISSSEIRESFRHGNALGSEMIPESVCDYILQTHLYQEKAS